jgi:hypothetical protein
MITEITGAAGGQVGSRSFSTSTGGWLDAGAGSATAMEDVV